jgi:hypothetical protein
MKRKKSRVGALNMNSIQSVAVNDVLPATVGFVAGALISKNISFLTNNPEMSNLVKLGGGIVLASMGNGLITRMGVGLAANGAYNLIAKQINLPQIQLLPPGQRSMYLAGNSSGMYGTPEFVSPDGNTVVKMQ